jgi:hypothetical protein
LDLLTQTQLEYKRGSATISNKLFSLPFFAAFGLLTQTQHKYKRGSAAIGNKLFSLSPSSLRLKSLDKRSSE